MHTVTTAKPGLSAPCAGSKGPPTFRTAVGVQRSFDNRRPWPHRFIYGHTWSNFEHLLFSPLFLDAHYLRQSLDVMIDSHTAPTSLSPSPCHRQTASTISNMPTSETQAGAAEPSESQSESARTANVLSDSLCSICLSRLTVSGEQVGQFFDCKEEADILQVRTESSGRLASLLLMCLLSLNFFFRVLSR